MTARDVDGVQQMLQQFGIKLNSKSANHAPLLSSKNIDLSDGLNFLRHNPQFLQLRQVVQQQPQMLEPILRQLGASNPQIAQLISSDPDQFLQLLGEDGEETDSPPSAPEQPISVTEEERDAIDRACRDPCFRCDRIFVTILALSSGF